MIENGAEVTVELHKEWKYSFIGPKKVIPDHGCDCFCRMVVTIPDGEY